MDDRGKLLHNINSLACVKAEIWSPCSKHLSLHTFHKSTECDWILEDHINLPNY